MTRRDVLLHGGLFVACCVTTTIASGPVFAATLMGILTCHEFGHYIAARVRGVDASLPYFIPMPPVLTFGTLGAVIRMRKPIGDRNTLFDVGAAGPIAGLVVAIPLLVIGLYLSDLAPQKSGDGLEGNSILYALLKYAVFGRWLPGDGIDVQLNAERPIGLLNANHHFHSRRGDRRNHDSETERFPLALADRLARRKLPAERVEQARSARRVVRDLRDRRVRERLAARDRPDRHGA